MDDLETFLTAKPDQRKVGFAHVHRTLYFLHVIAEDVAAAQDAYFAHVAATRHLFEVTYEAHGLRELTPEKSPMLEELKHANSFLQLRIESFYLFAQRLLDEVVAAMDVFFGPAAVTLGRHRTVLANLRRRVASGSIPDPPEELLGLITEVGDRIKAFRDDHVAHSGPPEVFARKFYGLQ